MKLVSMANKKESGKSSGAECAPCCCDEECKYPYGTEITLGNDQLKALGLTELPKVGAVLSISALVRVTSVNDREEKEGESEQRVCLQITDLGIESKMSESKLASTMFEEKE